MQTTPFRRNYQIFRRPWTCTHLTWGILSQDQTIISYVISSCLWRRPPQDHSWLRCWNHLQRNLIQASRQSSTIMLDFGWRSSSNLIVYWTPVRCQVLKGWPSVISQLSMWLSPQTFVVLPDFPRRRRFPEPPRSQLSSITTRTDMSKPLARKRRKMGYTKPQWIMVG